VRSSAACAGGPDRFATVLRPPRHRTPSVISRGTRRVVDRPDPPRCTGNRQQIVCGTPHARPIRRVDAGDLTDEQIERIGTTLMLLEEKMAELRDHFGLTPEDLNIDLGPLGPLLPREPP